MTQKPASVTLAATLILIREGGVAGGPEVLMLERAAHLFFAAGAWVFPGGRVEAEDRMLADTSGHAGDAEELGARVAAIRETIEEAGIAVGIVPRPDAALAATLRAGLVAGTPFAALLAAHGLALDLDALVLFARWQPDAAKRVFDTRFYVAAAQPDAVGEADGSETVRALWTTPSAALAGDTPGMSRIFFPTRCNLERIAALGSVDAIRTAVAALPVEKITPWVEIRDGEEWLCIPDRHGYPVTSARARNGQRN